MHIIEEPEGTAPPSRSHREASTQAGIRPKIKGKFLFVGDEKFLVKGVSYGAFRPNAHKEEYWDLEQIDRDFAQMANHGVNTVRIPHTMPPVRLLDLALKHDLKVMVGLSAEQYVGYLIDSRKPGPDVARRVREKVRTVAGHPALLCYGIGNEIPASVARWLGGTRIERYLFRLYQAIKAEDPDGIVTYVNYPSTEYLRLPFLDVVSFNVYLESHEKLSVYLARLQSLAEDRPLLMSEVGLDALRNGERRQADVLRWQVATSFTAGCAAENIAYGRPGARRNEIEAAAEAANAFEFINALPDGFETTVGERGMSLSGGERQRISLARAFLKSAPILILDEPTSSVDGASEAAIMDAMVRLMSGRTTCMIAHRLDTLNQCDLRLYFEEGGFVRSENASAPTTEHLLYS